MHSSIQFRHNATSTWRGTATVSDCTAVTHCFADSDMCLKGFREFVSRGQKFALQFWTLEEVRRLPVFFELMVAWLEFSLEWSLSFQICVTSCESCLPLESKVSNAVLHAPSASLWSESSNEETMSRIRPAVNTFSLYVECIIMHRVRSVLMTLKRSIWLASLVLLYSYLTYLHTFRHAWVYLPSAHRWPMGLEVSVSPGWTDGWVCCGSPETPETFSSSLLLRQAALGFRFRSGNNKAKLSFIFPARM